MIYSMFEYSAAIASLSADEFEGLIEAALAPDASEFPALLPAGV
jgi:hypothetical protein